MKKDSLFKNTPSSGSEECLDRDCQCFSKCLSFLFFQDWQPPLNDTLFSWYVNICNQVTVCFKSLGVILYFYDDFADLFSYPEYIELTFSSEGSLNPFISRFLRISVWKLIVKLPNKNNYFNKYINLCTYCLFINSVPERCYSVWLIKQGLSLLLSLQCQL